MAYKFNPFTGTLDDVGSGGAAGNFVTLDTVQTITAEKTIRNSTVDATPLIVNALAAHSGNLQSWQVNGAVKMSLADNGQLNIYGGTLTFADRNTSLVVAASTNARDIDIPGFEGGSIIPVVGFGTDPAGAGEVAVINRVGATAISGDVVNAKLTNGARAGIYMIAVTMAVQTAVASKVLTITASWAGDRAHVGQILLSPLYLDESKGLTVSGYIMAYLLSGDITWSATCTAGTLGTGRAALRIRCIYLGP